MKRAEAARGTTVAIASCMRHLLALVLVASCVATDEGPPPDPVEPTPDEPTPEPEPEEPTTPNEGPEAALLRWQQCMTFSDFQAANMAGAWTSVATTTNQKCGSCHAVASYGFVATSNAQQFFDVIKADKYLLQAFVDVSTVASQPGAYQVIVDEQTIPGAGSGGIVEHPRFNPAVGMAALRDFYLRTEARCAGPLECSTCSARCRTRR